MSLIRLECVKVELPLKKRITHASHQRSSSLNLVVRATLDDGSIGHGEGVPRSYVTGETVDSATAAIEASDVASRIGRPRTFEDAVEAVRRFELIAPDDDPRRMATNAARCAVELALLDAFGRRHERSLGDAIRLMADGLPGLRTAPGRVRYSGAITAETARGERISAWKMRLYGFDQVKIKVGVAGQDDPKRLSVLRRILGSRMDLRLDANEAWSAVELLERIEPLRRFAPSAIEQPIPHEEVDALSALRARIGIPIMLDESLCSLKDGRHAAEAGLCDLFNVRISKCGGLGPSLALIRLAHERGLGVQLGCHPGESGILSAAGRHLASNVDGFRYVEGSYDRHVLAENITSPDITFKYSGRAGPLGGSGLGVVVDRERLERLAIGRREVRFD